MDKILNLKSIVPEGKYHSTIVNNKLIKDRKEIIELTNKGYRFSSEVMEKAGFVKLIRNVTTKLSIVEHKKDNRVFEKDTSDVKSIIRSISTLDNGNDEITVTEEDNNKNDYDDEEQ